MCLGEQQHVGLNRMIQEYHRHLKCTKQMIEKLLVRYGKITAAGLQENKRRLNDHWTQINQKAVTLKKLKKRRSILMMAMPHSVRMISLKQHIMHINKSDYTSYHTKNGDVTQKTKSLGWGLKLSLQTSYALLQAWFVDNKIKWLK